MSLSDPVFCVKELRRSCFSSLTDLKRDSKALYLKLSQICRTLHNAIAAPLVIQFWLTTFSKNKHDKKDTLSVAFIKIRLSRALSTEFCRFVTQVSRTRACALKRQFCSEKSRNEYQRYEIPEQSYILLCRYSLLSFSCSQLLRKL